MNIEANLICMLLELTRNGLVSHEMLNKRVRVPREIAANLLSKLQSGGLLYVREAAIEADAEQRLRLAVHAIGLGADLERVSSHLRWQEFERMAAMALERNEYATVRNLRFKHAGRKWEIDVVGCRKPLVLCIDCKHWHHGMTPSSLARIVGEQVERTCALKESLPSPTIRIECSSWDMIKVVPAVLSLVAGRFRFYESVPVVPILQLQDFLEQLPAYADSLTHFSGRSQGFQYGFS